MKLEQLFNAVKEAEEVFNLNITTFEGVVWYYDTECNELHINTDACEEDLREGDGDTCSWEVRDFDESEDGYVVFADADSGCGDTDTIILKMSEKI